MQEFHLPSRSLFCRSSRRSTCRLGRSRVSYGHIAQYGTTQTQLVFSTTTLTYINRNDYSINTIRICLGAWTKMISSSTFLECSGITNAKTCWQPKYQKSCCDRPRATFWLIHQTLSYTLLWLSDTKYFGEVVWHPSPAMSGATAPLCHH